MAKKKGLPFWLGLVLAMVLAALLLLVAMAPQPDHNSRPSRPALSARHMISPVQTTKVVPEFARHAKEPPSQAAAKQAAPTQTLTQQTKTRQIDANQAGAGHGLSLILDDVGYNIAALQRVLALSVPVAISVLPDSPHAMQAAGLAHQAGQIVMLHLPMQPIDPSLPMSSAFLHEGMTDAALHDTFLHDMDQVPYVEGVNNHMGSKLTQMEDPMRQVMQLCRQKGLFFVDSRTTSDSVAAKVAKNMGLHWATRQVFLDHVMTPESMQQAWDKARACVRKGFRCIIIAHPRAASVAFLESHLTREDAAHMVPIKRVLRHTPQQPARLSSLQTP